jgi:hypothetical protein
MMNVIFTMLHLVAKELLFNQNLDAIFIYYFSSFIQEMLCCLIIH